MKVPVRNRMYDYSVINVAKDLQEHASGSSECFHTSVLLEMQDWLEWRISEKGWNPSRVPRREAYEDSVRAMAREALRIAKTGFWNPKTSSSVSIQELETAVRKSINEFKQGPLPVPDSLTDPKVTDYHKRVQAIREQMIEVERKLVAMVTDFHSITYSQAYSHTCKVQIFPSNDPTEKSGLWVDTLPLSQWNAYTLLKVAAALPDIVARVKEQNAKEAECYQRLEAAEKGLSQL